MAIGQKAVAGNNSPWPKILLPTGHVLDKLLYIRSLMVFRCSPGAPGYPAKPVVPLRAEPRAFFMCSASAGHSDTKTPRHCNALNPYDNTHPRSSRDPAL